MGKLHIHRLYYLLAAILLAGFIVGVFYLKVLLRGATVILYTLLLGMALGFIISIILIRLKKAFLLLASLGVLEVIWFAIPRSNSGAITTVATIILGISCSCGICSIPYMASLLSRIRKKHCN